MGRPPIQKSSRVRASGKATKGAAKSPPLPMKRLRLRGDWSDTGPNARPERVNPAPGAAAVAGAAVAAEGQSEEVTGGQESVEQSKFFCPIGKN